MSNLTLTATVAKYQSREAAEKHCSEIALQGSDVVAVLHKPHQAEPQVGLSNCARCGVRAHRGGRRQCPAFIWICLHGHKLGHFARVCRSRHVQEQAGLAKNHKHSTWADIS